MKSIAFIGNIFVGFCCLFVTTSCGRVGFDSSNFPIATIPGFSTNCTPLPTTTGPTTKISPGQSNLLPDIVNASPSGTTILLEDGTYFIPPETPIRFEVAGITLRSASGDPDRVTITSTVPTEISASGTTIAEIGFETSGIEVIPSVGQDTHGTLIYRVTILDSTVGVNIVPADETFTTNDNQFPDFGAVACSQIVLSDTGRAAITSSPRGIRGIGVRDWRVFGNTIEGYWAIGRNGRGILFDSGSRDTVVEQNYLRDNFFGIQLGDQPNVNRQYQSLPCGMADIQHFGGIVRNNMLFSTDVVRPNVDTAIAAWLACGVDIVHNTAFSEVRPALNASIETRYADSTAQVTNNLTSHRIITREGGTSNESGNTTDAVPSLFVDSASGDLHLNALPSEISSVDLDPGRADRDFDNQPRPQSAPHPGADQGIL